jgi:hypothetical protein
MALLNELDAPAAEAALRGWLADRLPDAADVTRLPAPAGQTVNYVGNR